MGRNLPLREPRVVCLCVWKNRKQLCTVHRGVFVHMWVCVPVCRLNGTCYLIWTSWFIWPCWERLKDYRPICLPTTDQQYYIPLCLSTTVLPSPQYSPHLSQRGATCTHLSLSTQHTGTERRLNMNVLHVKNSQSIFWGGQMQGPTEPTQSFHSLCLLSSPLSPVHPSLQPQKALLYVVVVFIIRTQNGKADTGWTLEAVFCKNAKLMYCCYLCLCF